MYKFYKSCQNMIATLENIMWHGEIPQVSQIYKKQVNVIQEGTHGSRLGCQFEQCHNGRLS